MTIKRRLLKILALIAASFGLFSIGLISAVFVSSLDISFSKQSLVTKIPKVYIVHSGSMEPAIKTGSLITSYPQDKYSPGDIITFNQEGKGSPTTHRIAFKLYPNGIYESPVYMTGGDANEELDNFKVAEENIIGKTVLTIPYLGYFANFAKTPRGFILLVIIPATIIVYEELRKFFEEISKILKKNRKKNLNRPIKIKKDRLPRITAVIPLAGAAIVFIGIASSYFFDIEKSVGNIFQAAGPSLPPIAQTLVINEVLPDTDCFVGKTEAQWIELYNGFPYAINPKNFKITDGVNTIDLVTANNLSIPSGGLLLLAHNNAVWIHCWDDKGVQTGNLGGTLNIDTEHLQLIDTDGTTVIDDVQWGGIPELDPSLNQSIEREPKGLDSATGFNFNPDDFEVRPTPFPGE